MTPTASQPRLTRVLLFVDNFDTGGTQTHVVNLANALQEDCTLQVHIGCLNRRGPLLKALRVAPERIWEYRLHRFYSPGGLGQMMRLARDIVAARVDLVHAHDFYADVMCTAAAAYLPRPRLIVSRRYEHRGTSRVYRYAERLCYRLADAVLFNSAGIAERLIADRVVARDKVVVIPNGVRLDRFAPRRDGTSTVTMSPERPCRIGVVARLAPVKGHETLLRAAADLALTWRNLEVVLVGDGELRGSLERFADQLGLAERVRFVGNQADVRPWLETFDVAVLPSYQEGLPNALLEYLAAGCPVVATNVGGIPEVVVPGRDALVVEPGDPTQLAAAIHRLLQDPPLRAAIARAGRRRAEEYRLDRMVTATRALYESLTTVGCPHPRPARSPAPVAPT